MKLGVQTTRSKCRDPLQASSEFMTVWTPVSKSRRQHCTRVRPTEHTQELRLTRQTCTRLSQAIPTVASQRRPDAGATPVPAIECKKQQAASADSPSKLHHIIRGQHTRRGDSSLCGHTSPQGAGVLAWILHLFRYNRPKRGVPEVCVCGVNE